MSIVIFHACNQKLMFTILKATSKWTRFIIKELRLYILGAKLGGRQLTRDSLHNGTPASNLDVITEEKSTYVFCMWLQTRKWANQVMLLWSMLEAYKCHFDLFCLRRRWKKILHQRRRFFSFWPLSGQPSSCMKCDIIKANHTFTQFSPNSGYKITWACKKI